jgi:hypothetical protein
MQYVPGPFENVLAMDFADTPWYKRDKHSNPHYTSVGFFEPWAAAAGVNVARYDEPLSSRDGFLLLAGSGSVVTNLCLCNPLARTCEFIPAAAFGASPKTCTYVLVTGHDDYCPSTGGGDAGDHSAVVFWILAVKREHDVERGVVYQIFSAASGEWGRVVKRSARFEEGLTHASICGEPSDMVVCRGCVYWLVKLTADDLRRCVFAVDVQTERTWRMELPEETWCWPAAPVTTTTGSSWRHRGTAGCR